MSRSNPTEGSRNPCTRWFEWAGGSDGGFVRWYNKDTEQHVKVEGAFTFLLLDQLSTVKGWHEPSQSSIYANEVRDTRQDALVVKAFKGGELASGIYADIKDRIGAKGGHYHASIYIAYKEGEDFKIGNLGLKGAAAGAWMDFTKAAGKKKYEGAIKIAGYEDAKKGATAFRVPKFALQETKPETNEQAVKLDAELQAFLADYLKRPKAEASKPAAPDVSPAEPDGAELARNRQFDDMESDIPF